MWRVHCVRHHEILAQVLQLPPSLAHDVPLPPPRLGSNVGDLLLLPGVFRGDGPEMEELRRAAVAATAEGEGSCSGLLIVSIDPHSPWGQPLMRFNAPLRKNFPESVLLASRVVG